MKDEIDQKKAEIAELAEHLRRATTIPKEIIVRELKLLGILDSSGRLIP